MNGTELLLGFDVVGIEKKTDYFIIKAANGTSIQAKTVVNAAGVNSDKMAQMVGLNDFTIIPRKGEYILFDKNTIPVKTVIFPTPTLASKGILVSPTLHTNIFIGPNAHECQDRDITATTTAGLNEIISGARKLVPNIPLRFAITNFAGVRATPSTHDFIIGRTSVPQFVNAAGIESPGLSSCLAIAEKIVEEVLPKDCGYKYVMRSNYIATRKAPERFNHLTQEQLAQKIKENPQWGQMVCRCEMVTEAEIVEACHGPIPVTNTDMIKRRLRPGMGRCQGGFCLPKVMKILSREQKIVYNEVTKWGHNSKIVMERTKNLKPEVYSKKQI
jgi:glycerol-3-phosphate dehydrogenase